MLRRYLVGLWVLIPLQFWAQSEHLKLYFPEVSSGSTLYYKGDYAHSFDWTEGFSEWVIYALDTYKVSGIVPRCDDFWWDDSIEYPQSEPWKNRLFETYRAHTRHEHLSFDG